MRFIVPVGILLLTCLGCQSTRPASTLGPCPEEERAGLAEPPRSGEEVEMTPQLIGGLGALQQQIRYPPSAMQEGVQGKVLIRFVVNEQGVVVQATVVQSVDPRLDAEALRVVCGARFEPGRDGGEAVPVEMTIPISFYSGRR